jgi:hypothetical protein
VSLIILIIKILLKYDALLTVTKTRQRSYQTYAIKDKQLIDLRVQILLIL